MNFSKNDRPTPIPNPDRRDQIKLPEIDELGEKRTIDSKLDHGHDDSHNHNHDNDNIQNYENSPMNEYSAEEQAKI